MVELLGRDQSGPLGQCFALSTGGLLRGPPTQFVSFAVCEDVFA
jgi:hypothetical protein